MNDVFSLARAARSRLVRLLPAGLRPAGRRLAGLRPAGRRLAGLWLASTLLLGGCAGLVTQNPASTLEPVNAVEAEGAERLMLQGYDLVAYFTEGRAVPGVAAHQSVYEKVAFRFASAEHEAMFERAPTKHLPQFGGFCASGMVYAIPSGGDPTVWRLIDGRLYVFGGQGPKEAFELDLPGNLKLAHHYWDTEVAGRNSVLQRIYRLVFRVPHFASSEELARRVAQAKAAGK